MFKEHFRKNNLHHAYLIEGVREAILPEVFELVEDFGVGTLGNPDFIHINIDSFKVDDARNLKSLVNEKANSLNKKVFLISANSFLLEAQNMMLKIFEEPIENTHFFVLVPDANALIPTFLSRFYLISARKVLAETGEVQKFIAMSLKNRIDFIKELLLEEEQEGVVLFSSKSKALKFLDALESVLHQKIMSKTVFDMEINFFDQIFKVREFLRMPGSSAKTLMESLALIIPNL